MFYDLARRLYERTINRDERIYVLPIRQRVSENLKEVKEALMQDLSFNRFYSHYGTTSIRRHTKKVNHKKKPIQQKIDYTKNLKGF